MILDVIGPLTTTIEQAEAGTLMIERAVAAAKMAIKFTGNTSVQISHEKRKETMDTNPRLVESPEKDTIVEDVDQFGIRFSQW